MKESLFLLLICVIVPLPISHGQEASAPIYTASSLPNLPAKTAGGKQFWTDHAWRMGWRIQQNAVTQHWRLVDPQDRRRAWGSYEACVNQLQQSVPVNVTQHKRVVVMLHGLFRTHDSMSALGEFLQQQGSLTIVNMEYASTRGSIEEHAAALEDLVRSLPDQVELNFVAHSMGNIVIRRAFYDWIQGRESAILDRVHSCVMLGPPNNGSAFARQLAPTGIFGIVAGDGASQLGENWGELSPKLAKPTCPFGIVAGRLSDENVANPFLNDASDFVVTVEETKLEGYADMLEIDVLHSFLMTDPRVQSAVLQFINSYRFR